MTSHFAGVMKRKTEIIDKRFSRDVDESMAN